MVLVALNYVCSGLIPISAFNSVISYRGIGKAICLQRSRLANPHQVLRPGEEAQSRAFQGRVVPYPWRADGPRAMRLPAGYRQRTVHACCYVCVAFSAFRCSQLALRRSRAIFSEC
ncbi:hypothetical protein M413DRAFT_388287 [Hebeloma cylindrosporum]|uniref:Uncharacterized protein n=1 Tax=Hebeloma cylindrosporum TaxID=76867 RepID=A0A0C2Y1N6_HEBCY|nr:hypothetical protein M413DRAFT_388287 [Hebeloma cylindrosporum h7]